MKKKILGLLVIALCFGFSACGNSAEKTEPVLEEPLDQSFEQDYEETSEESIEEVPDKLSNETLNDADVDAYYEKFLSGEIPGVYLDYNYQFYATDLTMNTDDWDSYSVGEKIDLDNDGVNELILDGPYGGMYLDVVNDQVVVFAKSEGAADMLSYQYYEDAYWIVKSDTTHGGREMYRFTKYNGSDTIADSFELCAEYWQQDDYDENSDFSYKGEKITMEEFEAKRFEILGR